jgi:hypothetical protein
MSVQGRHFLDQETGATVFEPFEALWNKAVAAGASAAQAAVPEPMTVVGGGKTYHVSEGVCGFGWVHFRDARSPFVKFLKSKGLGHKGYPRGWDVSAHQVGSPMTQSMDRNSSACHAAAKVLSMAGIECYSESRMD